MKSLNAFSANISMRYMMTRMVGIRMEFRMSKYASDVSNFSFESRQLRASAQMVLNVAQVAKFSKKTNHLGLLVHGGFELSSLNDDSYNIGNVIDNMAHVVVGITPQVKLTERLTIQLDYSVYGNMLQNKTFDLQSNVIRN